MMKYSSFKKKKEIINNFYNLKSRNDGKMPSSTILIYDVCKIHKNENQPLYNHMVQPAITVVEYLMTNYEGAH